MSTLSAEKKSFTVANTITTTNSITTGQTSQTTGQTAGQTTGQTTAEPVTNPITSSSNSAPIVAIVIGIIVPLFVICGIVAIVAIFLILRRRKKEDKSKNNEVPMQAQDPSKFQYSSMAEISPHTPNIFNSVSASQRLQIDPSAEIDINELEFGELVGSGAFGIVYK